MNKVMAVNTIRRRPDPKGPFLEHKPGAIFEVSEAEYDELMEAGAISEAPKAAKVSEPETQEPDDSQEKAEDDSEKKAAKPAATPKGGAKAKAQSDDLV